jgi:hypothetical protein
MEAVNPKGQPKGIATLPVYGREPQAGEGRTFNLLAKPAAVI